MFSLLFQSKRKIERIGGKSAWIKRKSHKYLTVLSPPVLTKKMHTVKWQPSPKLKMANPQQLRGWFMMNMMQAKNNC